MPLGMWKHPSHLALGGEASRRKRLLCGAARTLVGPEAHEIWLSPAEWRVELSLVFLFGLLMQKKKNSQQAKTVTHDLYNR